MSAPETDKPGHPMSDIVMVGPKCGMCGATQMRIGVVLIPVVRNDGPSHLCAQDLARLLRSYPGAR